MKYWLIKSEPGTWSWEDQKKAKVTMWDGVRNYQARNNMKLISVGSYERKRISGKKKVNAIKDGLLILIGMLSFIGKKG